MLEPRIYRFGFVAVMLAVIVFAFSLENQPGARHTNLTPDFNGAAALTTMKRLAKADPVRAPGSPQDAAVAGAVATALTAVGPKHPFTVSTQSFSAATASGTQILQTVTGLEPGLSTNTIAVIAPRDGSGIASLSGTAVLIQLAQVLGAQSLNHSILLASTSGTVGAAGVTQLANALTQDHVGAVIVLGDLAGRNTSRPLVVPWSDSRLLAAPTLRATLAAALRSQAGLHAGTPGVPAQLARLALPLTISPQGPINALGIPAVTLSVSGERGPTAREPIVADASRIGGIGNAVLETIDALDSGAPVPAASSYLSFDGQVVPFWAVRLLVLALLLPVLMVMVDGLARSRRRGHSIVASVAWVLAGALPFLIAGAIVRGAKLISFIAAPPGPVGANGVPLHGAGIVLLVGVALVLVLSFWLLRPLCLRALRSAPDDPPLWEGAGPALLLIACIATLAIWVRNPFAAVLVVLALHLWVWVVDSDLQLPRPVSVLMLLVGLVPPGVVVAYYVHSFGLSAIGTLWNGALLIAGGQISPVEIVEWSVILGCLASALVIALQARRHHRPETEQITVRGPITYAGPGSLGGTESAIRR